MALVTINNETVNIVSIACARYYSNGTKELISASDGMFYSSDF